MSEESFELKVVDVVEETADAHSISFEVPAGAEDRFAYKPGQFLTLAVPSDRTGVAARCYSLSSRPATVGATSIRWRARSASLPRWRRPGCVSWGSR